MLPVNSQTNMVAAFMKFTRRIPNNCPTAMLIQKSIVR